MSVDVYASEQHKDEVDETAGQERPNPNPNPNPDPDLARFCPTSRAMWDDPYPASKLSGVHEMATSRTHHVCMGRTKATGRGQKERGLGF